MPETADIVVCGAGIAGVSAAYHLAVKQGMGRILLVDERPPLTLTSDKSTEAYRNWWPGPDDAMVRLMNRSIDLLEALADESGNRFLLNRRGYVYATADPAHARAFEETAALAVAQGAGPLRVHDGSAASPSYIPHDPEDYHDQPDGADLILDRSLIREHFPCLSERTAAVLHTRRCGWFSGQQFGAYLLEQARACGVALRTARVERVDVSGGRVAAVHLTGDDGTATTVSTGVFVNAAGPLLRRVGLLLGVDLPVFSELHLKASFRDHLGVIPRDAPLLIWDDPQMLEWSGEEREMLAADPDTRWLTGPLPAGVHARPEGGPGSQNILILWPYHVEPVAETFPLPEDRLFAEMALRGMAAMVPGLRAYFEQMPRPFVDGGYYTKTPENRPLCGPLPAAGAYVIGALSGFGLMAAAAAGELLAAHVTGAGLPPYAAAFAPSRYDDPAYRAQAERWGSAGQL